MQKIFTGLLLVSFDFNLTLGSCVIGLIPDFLGYIFIRKGVRELREESPCFARLDPWTLGMAVYSGILSLLDLFGIGLRLGIFFYLMGAASLAASLYISYSIVRGVQDMEQNLGGSCRLNLRGGNLKTAWLVSAVASAISTGLLILPALATQSMIVALVAHICFLVFFNRAKNVYYAEKNRRCAPDSGDGPAAEAPQNPRDGEQS